ncbi:hypothetical protein THAOC_35918, partial [Thalassiosira oceanica]
GRQGTAWLRVRGRVGPDSNEAGGGWRAGPIGLLRGRVDPRRRLERRRVLDRLERARQPGHREGGGGGLHDLEKNVGGEGGLSAVVGV